MNYEGYKTARWELSELVEKQLCIIESSGYDEVVKTAEKPSELLRDTSERLKDEQLRVLVMGKFSSGKSTFLNGLLGEALLPMKATPCTAVISEIRYAEQGEITLIPKKGKWKDGDDPFVIPKSEIKDYITIDHTADEKKENPFKKMYLNWNLKICEKGIEFVDSPGLDDPDCHDDITREYLHTADAIIYCMHSSVAFSQTDKEIIEELRALGHTSIIFVLTNFDKLIENDEMMGSTDAKDLVEYLHKTLTPLTELGKEGIFFVNSLAAIMGKGKNDKKLLDSSNFPQLEEKIEHILVNQKGRYKLNKSLYSTKRINRENGRFMQDSVSLLEKDSDQLRQMVQSAQIPLDQAKSKADLIRSQVKNSFREIENNANDKGKLFIINCISKIDTWVDEYKPEQAISKNPLKLKESIKNYTQSCLNHIKYKMEEESKTWSNNELSPMIQNNLQSLFRSMEDKIKSYNNDLLDVRIKLDLMSEADVIAAKENPSVISRLAGVAYSIITFDFVGGVIGVAFGFSALLKTFITQLVAGIILGIVSLFTPLGLPVVIIGAVIAGLTGAGWTFASIQKNIKKEILKKTKETLSSEEKKQEILLKIHESVSKVISEIQKEVDEAVDADINFYQKLMSEASEKYTGNNQKTQSQIVLYKKLLADNHTIADKFDEFGQNLLT